jgi:hypothetical protein
MQKQSIASCRKMSFVISVLIIFLCSIPLKASVNVTFRVDATAFVHSGIFNPGADKVYLRGSFNNWQMNNEMIKAPSGFVYSLTIPLDEFNYYEYKYFITSPSAGNNGYEDSVGAANGNRYYNTLRFDTELKIDFFNNVIPSSGNISLTSPAAGSAFKAGTTQTISWSAPAISNITLQYTTDLGNSWTTIAESVPAANGNYSWQVPGIVAYEWEIRISDAADAANVCYSPIFITYSEISASVPPLLSVEYPVFNWPLNAYYPVTTASDDENINGRVGNACGPDAMANIMRYWEFPRKGSGIRSFTDYLNCSWSADFEGTEYNYDRMPAHVPSDAPDSVYNAVATLMYHAAVGMHNHWRTGSQDGILEAMHHYFNYSAKSKFIERDTYTPDQWDKIVKSELTAGRPLMTASLNHWFITDGYNTSNLFHIRWDYGEQSDEYLSLYRSGDAEKRNWMFVYLEPELNGKKVHVTYPNGGENLQQNSSINITWESTNVENVKIEYSTTNGYDWNEIADNFPAASGSYTWTNTAAVSKECKIRVSSYDDINIYDKSDKTFSVYDVQEVSVIQSIPAYVQSGTNLPVRWSAKGCVSVKIACSADGGKNWQDIKEANASDGVFNWTVPAFESPQCKIKISNMDNPEVYSETASFTIGNRPVTGGPYIWDNNTVALLHFNDNYKNEYNVSYSASPAHDVSFFRNFDLGLDYGLRINNSGTVCSNIEVPDYSGIDLSNDWTIDLWFKVNSWGTGNTAYPFLLSKWGANYFITLNPVNKTLSAGYDYDSGTEIVSFTDTSVVPDNWYHVTFIRSMSAKLLKCLLYDSTRQIIREGVVSFNTAHKPKINNSSLIIGGTSGNGNIQFDGFIDELRISNIVRPASSLKMTYPAGGEKFIQGTTQNIIWNSEGVIKVKLEYSTDNGTKWFVLKNNLDARKDSYTWTVPKLNSAQCLIRIVSMLDGSISDTCSAPFIILPQASVSVTSPNGSELWHSGSVQPIVWSAASINTVNIYFSSDGGKNWSDIVTSYPADSSRFNWTVPSVLSDNCLIKISSAEDTALYDISDTFFKTDIPGSVSGICMSGIPGAYTLHQNFPNPFNPATIIRFDLPEPGNTSLIIYNILGQKVKELLNEFKDAGYYKVEFNASELPSGIYIYQICSGNYTQTRKLMLLK